jgi:hypothetical protein
VYTCTNIYIVMSVIALTLHTFREGEKGREKKREAEKGRKGGRDGWMEGGREREMQHTFLGRERREEGGGRGRGRERDL